MKSPAAASKACSRAGRAVGVRRRTGQDVDRRLAVPVVVDPGPVAGRRRHDRRIEPLAADRRPGDRDRALHARDAGRRVVESVGRGDADGHGRSPRAGRRHRPATADGRSDDRRATIGGDARLAPTPAALPAARRRPRRSTRCRGSRRRSAAGRRSGSSARTCCRSAFGGNKLRNLEFLVGAALADGADTLVTTGRRWSNHARLTAAAGARAGLAVHLVLSGPPADPPTPGRPARRAARRDRPPDRHRGPGRARRRSGTRSSPTCAAARRAAVRHRRRRAAGRSGRPARCWPAGSSSPRPATRGVVDRPDRPRRRRPVARRPGWWSRPPVSDRRRASSASRSRVRRLSWGRPSRRMVARRSRRTPASPWRPGGARARRSAARRRLRPADRGGRRGDRAARPDRGPASTRSTRRRRWPASSPPSAPARLDGETDRLLARRRPARPVRAARGRQDPSAARARLLPGGPPRVADLDPAAGLEHGAGVDPRADREQDPDRRRA